MKFSVVTVCYNSESTISKTLDSVYAQSYKIVEHVIIDGGSTDETKSIIQNHASNKIILVSEPDDGIYDAMNKGLKHSSGDVVCFLNSDDYYIDSNVLNDVFNVFSRSNVDFVYGDLQMVDAHGTVKRLWNTGVDCEISLKGKQIPHPVFFVRSAVLRKLSPAFDPTYRIAADLKQQLILINKNKAVGKYLPRSLAVMCLGGASTASFNSYFTGWLESRRAYNDVFVSGGFLFVIQKVLSKIPSLFASLIR